MLSTIPENLFNLALEPGSSLLVAMSGGVDSSVCTALLHDKGYKVFGVFMRNGIKHKNSDTNKTDSNQSESKKKSNKQGCCSVADSLDASRVASTMDIPFYVLNFEEDFSAIIDYFIDEYQEGRTPNPCIVCNNDLKFGKLLEYADDVGAEKVVTGHYAQVRYERGRWRLYRGVDPNKDQSYYLFGLTQNQLSRCLFPLGALTKKQVRSLAQSYNLKTMDKPESQEICFVPDNNYRNLLKSRKPELFQDGAIIDQQGKQLGKHQGSPGYTVGQRKGLGIGGGKPFYVLDIDPQKNQVIVGGEHDLLCSNFVVERPHLIGLDELPQGKTLECLVQIRYRHTPVPAQVQRLTDNSLFVELRTPEKAVAPGQAAVFYHDQECLGGGWISKLRNLQ